jgi:hypothetical protein
VLDPLGELRGHKDIVSGHRCALISNPFLWRPRPRAGPPVGGARRGLFNERASATEPHAGRIGRDGMPGPEWLRTCGRRRSRRRRRRPNTLCGRTRYRSRGTSQPPPPRKRWVSPLVPLFEPLPYSPLPPQSSAPSLIFSRLLSPFNALRADPSVCLCLESPALTKSCSLEFVPSPPPPRVCPPSAVERSAGPNSPESRNTIMPTQPWLRCGEGSRSALVELPRRHRLDR